MGQPFAALKQQVNIRPDSSRVLAMAVVIGAEIAILLQLRCQPTTASRDSITESQRFSSCSSHCDTTAKIQEFF